MSSTVVRAASNLATISSIVLEKTTSKLDLATQEVMHLTFSFQSTLLDTSRSATARRLPYHALKLCLVETTISASQLEEQFLENHDIVGQTIYHIADRGSPTIPVQNYRLRGSDTNVSGQYENCPLSRGDRCGDSTRSQA